MASKAKADSQDEYAQGAEQMQHGIKPKRQSQVYDSKPDENNDRSPYYDSNTNVDLEEIQNYNRSRKRYGSEEMLQEGFPGQRTPPSRQGGSRLRGLLSRQRDEFPPGGIRLSNLRFNNELSRKSKRSLHTKVSVRNLNEHSRSSRKSQNDKAS